ncbi:MAG: antitoxin family protein [Candidatus Korarchaeota archaeon]|nr:antitoxin family protein [Candidatus Korarchaeota archaeon]
MSGEIVIEAVYEGGVFRPLRKVDLPEGKRVRVVVEESIVDVARRLREKYRVSLSTEEIEEFLAGRR